MKNNSLQMIWLEDSIYNKAFLTKNYNDFLYLIDEITVMFMNENFFISNDFENLNLK